MSKRIRRREHERLKPTPLSEHAMILTKKSIAKSQLETAIWLWFQNDDPLSTLVLAFNAHEILHALGEKIGKPSEVGLIASQNVFVRNGDMFGIFVNTDLRI